MGNAEAWLWHGTVDGAAAAVAVPHTATLAETLRALAHDRAEVPSVKIACDEGTCGACSVLLDGQRVLACLVPAQRASGRKIQTVVSFAGGPIPQALAQSGALQCGFCTPGMVVALAELQQQGFVPKNEDELAAELASNLCRCTGYRQLLTCGVQILRGETSPSQGTPQSDALEKACGRVAFATDLQVAHALFGVALRSPHGHARLLALDLAQARAMPGVHAVISALEFDAPPVPGEVFYDSPISSRPLLDAEACHAGAPVALLAAETREQAFAALAVLQPQWQLLETVMDLPSSRAENGACVHTGQANAALPFGPIHWQTGDVDAAFVQAASVREDWFSTATVQAGALEPYFCVVQPRSGGGLIVHKGVPAPFELRRQLAQWLKVSEDQVEIRCPPVGGGFGSRMDDLEYLAALLGQQTQKPVQMQLDRGSGWLAGRVRHGAQMRVKSGLDGQGKLLVRELEVFYDTGAYLDLGPFVVLRALRPLALYPAPNQRFIGHVCRTNKPIAGATRGFGNPQATFAIETHTDLLCRDKHLDPIQFRRDHLTTTAQANISVGVVNTENGLFSPKGAVISSCEIRQCLDLVEKSCATALTALPPTPTGCVRGVGLACAMHTSGKGRAEVSMAQVLWTHEGLFVRSGAPDQGGTGVATTLQLVAAEALNLPLEQVKVVLEPTSAELEDSGAHASGRTYVAGTAVFSACAVLLKRRDAGESLPLETTFRHVPATNAPPFAACQAIVDVDLATGQIHLRWLGLGVDAGRILNPLQARGQVLGAAVQGIGYALTERLDFDAQGRLATGSLADYGTPRAFEVPPIDVLFAQSHEPTHPLGCKGVGEIGLMAVAPAIANAVARAIGAPLFNLPLTAESVWRALQQNSHTLQDL